MKVLIYAGSEFMTSDTIADALMRYSEALTEGQNAGTIDVPIVEADGTSSTASFLVGPASQIVAKPVVSQFADPIDAAVLARIEAATRGLHPTASIDVTPQQQVEWDWEE